jgi:uncharacterized protein (TIGR03435 family)
VRRTAAAAIACLSVVEMVGAADAARYAQEPPQFEVATVRRNTSSDGDGAIGAQPNGRFVVHNVPLRFILQVVYEVPAFRVTGGPEWVDNERWDIQAKADGPVPESQLHSMMRTLLAERFKLKLRPETRETAGFALVRARPNGPLGPQLRAHPEPCPPASPSASPPAIDAAPPCGRMSGSDRVIRISARSLSDFAAILARRVARPVVDRTGLAGLYDLDLRWTADARSSAPLAQAPTAPDDSVSLFTALQEQLGLRLQSERVEAEFLIVERVERPTED